MKNNKIIQWFLKHSLAIASCVLIAGLGIAFLVWSSPGTTTIGEDISTGNITASGDVTVSGSLEAKTGRTATLIVAAADSSTTSKAQADYVCTGTNDHVQIQAAIDDLPATGGEVFLLDGTYNIEVSLVLDSYQTLRGCGRNTVLTTTTAGLDIITATGTSGNEKTGILIADLSIDGTAGGASVDVGVYFIYVDYSKIRNVWAINCGDWAGITLGNSDYNEVIGNTCEGDYEGIYIYDSSHNTISGNTCEGSEYEGIILDASSNNTIVGNTCQGNSYEGIYLSNSNHNTVSGNTCQGNGGHGIILKSSSNNTLTGNTCAGNDSGGTTYSGIYIKGATSSGSNENVVTGNHCDGNGLHGIFIDHSSHCTLTGNVCNNQNTGDGINVSIDVTVEAPNSDYNLITGNICYNNASNGIEIAGGAKANQNMIQANQLTGNIGANLADAGTLTQVYDDNDGIEITDVKMHRTVKNTSGGALAVGDVVVLKAVVAGNEITTTTTAGDDKVFGMVAESIADNAYGYVLVEGKTTALKVSGEDAVGGDIAIGDLLGTHDAAGISQKAAAGDMAFAIALEAYAGEDHSGIIDALLITPRKL